MVWGSSSLFVQVTVLPTGTVSVAGANLKFSIVTALPATGAAGPVDEEDVAAGPAVVDGIPLMPGIPGVTLTPDPKFTVGRVSGAGEEQAASSRTAAVASVTARQGLVFTPTHRRVGYTDHIGGWVTRIRSAGRVAARAPRSPR